MASVAGAFSLLPLALIPHWAAASLGCMGIVAMVSISDPAFLVYHQESVSPA